MANGIADDALSSIVLASTSPVIICLSMNKLMWANKIVQKNIMKLKNNKYHIVEPESGEMVCGEIGIGRLAQIESIIKKVNEVIQTKVQ